MIFKKQKSKIKKNSSLIKFRRIINLKYKNIHNNNIKIIIYEN